MKTRALVIKKQNTNEYDQLVTCYTQEYGKLTAVAKSILKKNSIQAMHLDALNLVNFELVDGRAMPIITGAQAETQFLNIKNSLPHLSVAYFFTEILDRVVFDNQKDPELWNFLEGVLSELNSGKEVSGLGSFFRQKQAEFLKILGYFPQINQCGVCLDRPKDDESNWALNPDLGSTICGGCFLRGYGGILLKKNDWEILKNYSGPILASSKSVLDSLFEYLAEDRLKSLDFLRQSLILRP